MNPTIVLLCPYYGTPPNYFQLWLDSCRNNPDITWNVIGEVHGDFDWPSNVAFTPLQFPDLRVKIQSLFTFRVALSTPIKICDFRPAFGEIFADVTTGFDYWGHCDVDTIWGRLGQFLTPPTVHQYDKIFTGGHLSIYRNSPEVNSAYRSASPSSGGLNYENVFRRPDLVAFDEWGSDWNGINHIIPSLGLRLESRTMPYADIKPEHRALRTTREGFGSKVDQLRERALRRRLFLYDHGKLTQHATLYGEPVEREEAYVHLQKRPMNLRTREARPAAYAIAPPNRIVDVPDHPVPTRILSRLDEIGPQPQSILGRVRRAQDRIGAKCFPARTGAK